MNCCICGHDPAQWISSAQSGQRLKLSQRDIQIINAVWQAIPDKQQCGQQIFAKIFKQKPSLKQLFHIGDVRDEDLTKNVAFTRHAASVMLFLDIAVKSLSLDTSYVVGLCRNLGTRHVAFRGASFDAEHWLVFKNAFVEEITAHCQVAKSKRIWSSYIAFVIREMKDAFCTETTRRHSITDLLSRHTDEGDSDDGEKETSS